MSRSPSTSDSGSHGSQGPPYSVPRGWFSIAEACEHIGVSDDFFREHVAPFMPIARVGRRRLVRRERLDAWLAEREMAAADALAPREGALGHRESAGNGGQKRGARQRRAIPGG